MESQQTGLLERLRQQRESMQAAATTPAPPPGMIEESGSSMEHGPGSSGMSLQPMSDDPPRGAGAQSAADRHALLEEHGMRIGKLEHDGDDVRRRLEQVEANLRAGLADLRAEVPGIVAGEVTRHVTATNEAVADLGGRVGRIESDFTRERERWASVVTSFDQRLDQRLRSFRQDVTVMLTGMAVLILAMLLMMLLRR